MEAILRLLAERPMTAVKNQLRDVVTMGVAMPALCWRASWRRWRRLGWS
ncbi:MAG: hypothetical protein HZT43_08585 [Exiguobacterium profundum]|nr:MAG: hypothetical protein HZT43_08585 [Exiguobacterium profundum]